MATMAADPSPDPQNEHTDNKLRQILYNSGFVVLAVWVGYNMSTYPKLVYLICMGSSQLEAYNLVQFSNDLCSSTLSLLVFLMWKSLCFKDVQMRHVWSWKPFFFPSTMMPGGFFPLPAAASVGLLLFVTKTFVAIEYTEGTNLDVKEGQFCRAAVRELTSHQHEWFARMHRKLPLGCFTGEGIDEHFAFPQFFDRSILNASDPSNLGCPYQVPEDPLELVRYGLRGMCVGSLEKACDWFHGTSFGFWILGLPQSGRDCIYTCVYQCIKWKDWAFQDMVENAGKLFGGAVIVAKVTSGITSRAGWPRVDEKTTPAWIEWLLQTSHPVLRHDEGTWTEATMADGQLAARGFRIWIHRWVQQNRVLCAVVFLGLRLVSNWCFKFTDHGMYSLDFYVTETLVCSVGAALILRSFNLYWFVPLVYTKELWDKGAQTFAVTNFLVADDDGAGNGPEAGDRKPDADPVHKFDIDLYMWLHMGYSERSYLLIAYARQVSKRDIGKRVKCIAPFALKVFTGGQEFDNYVIQAGNLGTLKKLRDDEATVEWQTADKQLSGKCDKSYLVEADMHEKWVNIVHKFVGKEEEQKKAVKRIQDSHARNDKDEHTPSIGNTMKQAVSRQWGRRPSRVLEKVSRSFHSLSQGAFQEPFLR